LLPNRKVHHQFALALLLQVLVQRHVSGSKLWLLVLSRGLLEFLQLTILEFGFWDLNLLSEQRVGEQGLSLFYHVVDFGVAIRVPWLLHRLGFLDRWRFSIILLLRLLGSGRDQWALELNVERQFGLLSRSVVPVG